MKKLKYLVIAFICLILLPISANATTGKITVSSSSTAIVGNTVTVTVTLSSSTAIGSWEMNLNYDKNYLQLTSSTGEAGGTGMVNSSSGTKSKTYTFKFKALKSGSTKVSVGSYLAYAYSDESEISLTTSSKTIKIMTQAEVEASYSKDNYLKALSVSVGEDEYELSPEFDKETTEYSVIVPEGTTSVNINATKNDSTASVSGDGDVTVSEGINTIEVVVTAQNGDQKTYTINVNVEDENPITVTVDGKNYTIVKSSTLLECPALFEETTVTINGYEIPAFINTTTSITLVGLKDESGNISLFIYNDDGTYSPFNMVSTNNYILLPLELPEDGLNYSKTTVTINDESVEAYILSDDGNIVIIYAKNLETGETGYYLYNLDDGTAMPYDESYFDIDIYDYVILVLFGICVVMLIIIIILICSNSRKQKKIKKFVAKQEEKMKAAGIDNKTDTKDNKAKELDKKVEQKNDKQPTKEASKEEIKDILKEKPEDKKDEYVKLDKVKKQNKTPQKNPFEWDEEQTMVKEPTKEVKDNTEEVYDIFEDDKKKKKTK